MWPTGQVGSLFSQDTQSTVSFRSYVLLNHDEAMENPQYTLCVCVCVCNFTLYVLSLKESEQTWYMHTYKNSAI
jgi:hypothetical protein